MAASIQNRQISCMEPGFSSYNRRSNTSLKGCNFPADPESEIISRRQEVFSSDSDEEDDGNQYLDLYKSAGENELEPPAIDSRDEGTADKWIERNPSLIRLTGKHPFNAEPPLTRLMDHGFITPVDLHYVRNHGSVPKATWNEWEIEICGLVKRPRKFTLNELITEFPWREFPATLVCAGNRRKEENMVKKTIGFNWGAAGVSTSIWRGVPLHKVLKRCGIFNRKNGALNVCFEGAEDLPGGGGGGGGSKYGTSIQKEVAMDPSRDIIVAYMQNGKPLTPDHGFPIRMIIPGFIGGRMVKWLKRIVITTKESDNYYHYKDNRVLPSHVDAELANSQAWWYKPEYIINEVNINSVITTPNHEDNLPINKFNTQRSYTLKGYAYSGGGKKVTRVEVTTNGGEVWRVCSLEHPEKPNKYGRYWCWCFWSLELEVLDLLGAKDIAVRAWDETHNTQPEKLLWNVMGMMNNCWFKVKTSICEIKPGEVGIKFEHPTQPGSQSGGWMAKERHLEMSTDAIQTLKKSVSTPFMTTTSQTYLLSDVIKHNSQESAWIIVHGHVYDCTKFLHDHPGGADSILINGGTDCTDEFDAIHSDKAKSLLEGFRIGELMTTGYGSDSTASSPNSSVHGASKLLNLATINETGPTTTTSNVALIPNKKIPCKLVSKTTLSHDVRKFRFALPSEDQVLGLPVGKHIYLCATINNKLCMRAYTPTSGTDEVGYFDLVVKIYFKEKNPKFPNGGLMSQFLESLTLGSILEVKGPVGHIEYAGHGLFLVGGKPKFAKRLAMVAGGTGITPIYQVMQTILNDPEDDTEMHLVYANRTENDILLRDELDAWRDEYPDRVKVWYVVSKSVEKGWNYSVGLITENILREHMPPASDKTLALACGPPTMIKFVVAENLEKMGYNIKDALVVF